MLEFWNWLLLLAPFANNNLYGQNCFEPLPGLLASQLLADPFTDMFEAAWEKGDHASNEHISLMSCVDVGTGFDENSQ